MAKSKSGLGGKPTRKSHNPKYNRVKSSVKGETTRLNARVPADLHAEFQSAVEAQGLTMTHEIIRWMRHYVEEHA